MSNEEKSAMDELTIYSINDALELSGNHHEDTGHRIHFTRSQLKCIECSAAWPFEDDFRPYEEFRRELGLDGTA